MTTKERLKDKKFLFKVGFFWVLVFLFYQVVYSYAKDRFELIRSDYTNSECLPHNLFIVDTYDKEVKVGDYVTFFSKDIPKFPDGKLFTKMVAAVEGDTIEVRRDMTIAKNMFFGPLDVLDKLERPAEDFERKEIVPKDKIFALGTKPNTYDSRYWGYVDKSQIYGRTYGIY